MRRGVRRWLVWTAAMGSVALGPSAWSRAPDVAAFQGASSKPGDIRACSLFTQAEIKKVYGAKWRPLWDAVQMPPEETLLADGGSECATLGLHVQLDAVPVSRFEANLKAYAARSTFERITGVGDEAWFYEQRAGSSVHIVGVYARSGQHVYILSIDVLEGDTAASLRPIVIALGQAAAAKLR